MYIFALPASTLQGLKPCSAPISFTNNYNEREHIKGRGKHMLFA
jgi:hypothetical protein